MKKRTNSDESEGSTDDGTESLTTLSSSSKESLDRADSPISSEASSDKGISNSDSLDSLTSAGKSGSDSSDESLTSSDSRADSRADSPISSETSSAESIDSAEASDGVLSNSVALLRTAYDFAFDQIEKEENQKSEAQYHDEERYTSLANTINDFIGQYDLQISKQGSDLDKYLTFIDKVAADRSGSPLSIKRIRELQVTLTDKNPQTTNNSNDLTSKVVNKALKVRRAAVSFAAGFIIKPKDVAKFKKLPKEKKEQIKLVQKCIELENNQQISTQDKKDARQAINKEFDSLVRKEFRKNRDNIWRIMARRKEHGELFSHESRDEIRDAMLHPFQKITEDKDLTLLEKTAKITMKVGEKALGGGKYLVGKVAEVAQYVVKHSIKQPVMAAYRLPMSTVNGLEYLTLKAQAAAENDLKKKAQLEQDADIKFKNLGYEGEKFIRAVAATAGIALVDTAIVSTLGAHVPAMAAVHVAMSSAMEAIPAASGAHHGGEAILITAEAAHQVQNVRDGVEAIKEKVDLIEKHQKNLQPHEKKKDHKRKNIHKLGIIGLLEFNETGSMEDEDSRSNSLRKEELKTREVMESKAREAMGAEDVQGKALRKEGTEELKAREDMQAEDVQGKALRKEGAKELKTRESMGAEDVQSEALRKEGTEELKTRESMGAEDVNVRPIPKLVANLPIISQQAIQQATLALKPVLKIDAGSDTNSSTSTSTKGKAAVKKR